MKLVHKHLIAASLVATLGLPAMAQTPPAAAIGAAPAAAVHDGHRQRDPAKMQERLAKRQAELKQLLQISAAQEGAWNSFTTAMKPPANLRRLDPAELEKLSTPDRIDHRRALRNERIAEIDRRGDATKAFYATLAPEQKKVFDSQTAMRGHRGHHRGQHGGMGPSKAWGA